MSSGAQLLRRTTTGPVQNGRLPTTTGDPGLQHYRGPTPEPQPSAQQLISGQLDVQRLGSSRPQIKVIPIALRPVVYSSYLFQLLVVVGDIESSKMRVLTGIRP